MNLTPSPLQSGATAPPSTPTERIRRLQEALEQKGGRLTKEQLENLGRDCGWTPEQVTEAKTALLHQGLVVAVRGRDGGVRRVAVEPTTAVDTSRLEKAKLSEISQTERTEREAERRESELYPYLQGWGTNAGYGIVALVADARPVARKVWENPDILLVDVLPLSWSVAPQIDVTVVEVKLALTPQAVWQAAHYRTFAHYVYLACLESPEAMRRDIHEGRLFALATDLGLGLISLRPAGSGAKGLRVDEIHSPARHAPEAAEVDRLLTDYENVIRESDVEGNLRRPGQILAAHLSSLR
jgi:hypothetical protein